MVRECLVGLALVSAAGCSLVLDFSSSAVPIDAQIDAPYTQEQCDYKEPNDSFDTAQVVTPADTGPAAICGGETEDHDFYKFTVPAGTTKVVVRISFTNRASGDLDLKLHDAGGVNIASSRGFGNEEVITCPSQAPLCPTLAAGDYIFEAYPAIAGAVNTYDFSVTLTP
jgi:pre-peptidase